MRASLGWLPILLFTSFVALPGCPGNDKDEGDGPAFTQADLAGRWRYTILFAGPSVSTGAVPGWSRGTLSIDASGVMALETYADNTGSTTLPSLPPVTYAIDGEGVITATTTAFLGYHGKMNPAKTLFVSTATQTTGAGPRVRLAFAQKIVTGTAYGASDVAGATFGVRQFASGVTPSWKREWVDVAADGIFSVRAIVDPSGPKPDEPSVGTFSVTGDGVLTASVSPSFAAFVSFDKQSMVGTETDGSNYRLLTIVRAGAGFTQADLVGRWHYLNLAAADDTAGWAAGWAHGTVTFDAAGVGTFGPQVDSSGLGETPSPVTLSVASDGTVTQTSPAPSVFNGILTSDKTVMIATETHGPGVYGIIVAIR